MANESIWDKLHYDRNAVIEASAGTGKTYTLEHIVEKLVLKEKYDIRSLLLVTFTEKAAGELKERIRKMLSENEAAKHLDEATICTIHSFCREVLASYPFESGMSMGVDIGGSDEELCKKAVHNMLASREFQEAYASRFAKEMECWNADGDADGMAKAAVSRLIKIVCKDNFEEWQQEVAALNEGLQGAMDRLPGWNEGGPGAYAIAHTENGSTFRNRQDWNSTQYNFFSQLDDKIRIVKDPSSDPEDCMAALDFICQGKVDFKLHKWDGTRIDAVFCERPGFETYAEVKELAAAKVQVLRETILRDVVGKAYPEFVRLKLRSSTVTFDDLIRETARLVVAATSPGATDAQKGFVKRMRDRYRLALVDEFQDTDAKQWQIFKKIFADEGHLIVVGDPKQAIYGWRGADLAAYMSAKAELLAQNGQFESLDKMYRSTEDMVNDFHTMFANGWFAGMEAGGQQINYQKVSFPQDNPPEKVKDFHYPAGEKAVELLEAKDGIPQFVDNAANEMIRLNNSQEWGTCMGWDDMCVLVRSNKVGHLVQQKLLAKNIPCRFYHERGFFAGEESESVLALLDYLSMPRSLGNLSALLLTPLFGFTPQGLDARLKNGDAAFDWLCERWRNYADKHDWIKLFESVMRETKAVDNPAGYRQVFDQLLKDYGRVKSVAELADALRALKSGDAFAGENGSVRNKASEASAVQVMTMHAAKGLEFNAVFVAAGFSGLSNDRSKDDRPLEEKKMEACRLFYVALTRAVFKLYLPWSRNVPEEGLGKRGSALQGYLGNAIRVLCNHDVESRMRDPGEQEIEHVAPPAPDQRECPPRLGMKGWRFKWDSFSSLNHHGAKKVEEVDGTKPKEDENQNATDDQNENEEQQKSLVPKGALSGTVFHEVMEKLCEASDGIGFEIGQKSEDEFKELIAETDDKKSPLLELVRRRMAANGVTNQVRNEDGETTASVIARMAWNALRTELDFGGSNKFKLCEIPLKDRKAEVNFVLDESNLGGVREEGAGALNGSIDLLVRRDDGYYIVDWKTNALDDYKDATVATAMDEAGYDLQYKIYTLAAEKWLGEKTAKGVAYLFVRGGETGTNASGKFVHTIKEEERAEYAKSFRDRIDASDKEEADKEKEEL